MDYFRGELDDPALAMFLFKIGRPLEADTAAWRAVRTAQDRFADADDRVVMVSDVAVEFAERA